MRRGGARRALEALRAHINRMTIYIPPAGRTSIQSELQTMERLLDELSAAIEKEEVSHEGAWN